jgi:hypothetical protein
MFTNRLRAPLVLLEGHPKLVRKLGFESGGVRAR